MRANRPGRYSRPSGEQTGQNIYQTQDCRLEGSQRLKQTSEEYTLHKNSTLSATFALQVPQLCLFLLASIKQLYSGGGQECKNAIDLWSCCCHDAGVNSDSPSITTSRRQMMSCKIVIYELFCQFEQVYSDEIINLKKKKKHYPFVCWREIATACR